MITAVVGMFISNTATAILMAPVSSPFNTLVVGPGNYRFTDFLRLGVPFTVLVLVASVIMVPLLL